LKLYRIIDPSIIYNFGIIPICIKGHQDAQNHDETLTKTFTDETRQRTSETHSWSSSQPKLLFFNNLESSRKTLQLPSYQQKLVLMLTWSENTKLQIC